MARVIDLAKMPECTSWGYQGESGATILVADVGEFMSIYPVGQANVIFQRQDGHPYMHKFSTVGENLFIELNSTDTQQQGKCEVQISWIAEGNRVLKKKIYRSYILPGSLEGDLPLTNDSIVALDSLQEYVEQAKTLLEEAKQYAAELVFVDEMPADGEIGKLYIQKDTSSLYFWNGDVFMLLNPKYVPEEQPEKPEHDCNCRPPHPPKPPIPECSEEILYGGNAFYPLNDE